MTLDAVTCSGIHLDILHLGEALHVYWKRWCSPCLGLRWYFFKISLECSYWVPWHSDESLGFFFFGCSSETSQKSLQLKWENWFQVVCFFPLPMCSWCLVVKLETQRVPAIHSVKKTPFHISENLFVLNQVHTCFLQFFKQVHVYICVENHPI